MEGYLTICNAFITEDKVTFECQSWNNTTYKCRYKYDNYYHVVLDVAKDRNVGTSKLSC